MKTKAAWFVLTAARARSTAIAESFTGKVSRSPFFCSKIVSVHRVRSTWDHYSLHISPRRISVMDDSSQEDLEQYLCQRVEDRLVEIHA
jgi:hypothetical protein